MRKNLTTTKYFPYAYDCICLELNYTSSWWKQDIVNGKSFQRKWRLGNVGQCWRINRRGSTFNHLQIIRFLYIACPQFHQNKSSAQFLHPYFLYKMTSKNYSHSVLLFSVVFYELIQWILCINLNALNCFFPAKRYNDVNGRMVNHNTLTPPPKKGGEETR